MLTFRSDAGIGEPRRRRSWIPDGLDAGRQLDRTVSPSTTWTTVPARGAGVGASVGVGSEVGDVVGVAAVSAATSWSLPPATAPAATLFAPTANRAIICVAFGGDAPDVMAKLISGPVGETGPRAQPHGMEPPNQLPNRGNCAPPSTARFRQPEFKTPFLWLRSRARHARATSRAIAPCVVAIPLLSARRSGNLRAASPRNVSTGRRHDSSKGNTNDDQRSNRPTPAEATPTTRPRR